MGKYVFCPPACANSTLFAGHDRRLSNATASSPSRARYFHPPIWPREDHDAINLGGTAFNSMVPGPDGSDLNSHDVLIGLQHTVTHRGGSLQRQFGTGQRGRDLGHIAALSDGFH